MASLALSYFAIVLSVIDGDTIKVEVPSWSKTPFHTIDLRVEGIDTPELSSQFAKCGIERRKGLIAKVYAESLARPGDRIKFTFKHFDKYGGRVVASVKLKNGEDFATKMINSGLAVSYSGKGVKYSWCPE